MTGSALLPSDPTPASKGPRLTRRELLALTLALGLLEGLPKTISASMPFNEPLLDLVPNRAAAAALGRIYLALHPDEADLGPLREHLHARSRAPASDGVSLRAQIEQQLRMDYLRGDLVEVDGWLLSRTEARLYALAALSDPPLEYASLDSAL